MSRRSTPLIPGGRDGTSQRFDGSLEPTAFFNVGVGDPLDFSKRLDNRHAIQTELPYRVPLP